MQSFSIAVAEALAKEDGHKLAALLALDKRAALGSAAADALIASAGSSPEQSQLEPHFRSVSASWRPVVVSNVQATCAAAAGRHLDALSRCIDALDTLNSSASEYGQWIAHVLLALCRDATRECARAGREAAGTGRKEAHQGLVDRLIPTVRNSWTACFNHRVPREELGRSRKVGARALACVYFSLHMREQPRQCGMLIASMEREGQLPPLSAAPIAQAVTYRYYTGLLALYEEKYSVANEHLSFALQHCHREYSGNVRRILETLLPVKLKLGQAPPMALLQAYGLHEQWGGVVEGVTQGNISSFRTALALHQPYFIKLGVYLILESLWLVVLRTFLKRVQRALTLGAAAGTSAPAAPVTQLRLPLLVLLLSSPALLGPHGEPIDLEELQCLCAGE